MQVDVLVNNAALGSATVQDFVRGSDSSSLSGENEMDAKRRQAREDEAMMRVNALGPLWVTQGLMSCMGCDGHRSIVLFVGSVGGSSQSVFPGLCVKL